MASLHLLLRPFMAERVYPIISKTTSSCDEQPRDTASIQKAPDLDNRAPPGLCGWLGELPASAVAAATTTARAATSAAAHLGEAIAAIDGLITARLEGHTRLAATVRADGGVHLTRGAVAAISARHGRLARIAALRAARRGVCQPFAGVKLLLARCEDEVTSTVAASECLIGGQNSNLLSGPVAPLSARTKTAPHMCMRRYPLLGKRCREAAGYRPEKRPICARPPQAFLKRAHGNNRARKPYGMLSGASIP
jgi:hypothetical protein